MMKKWIVLTALCAALAVALAACGKADAQKPAPTETPAAPAQTTAPETTSAGAVQTFGSTAEGAQAANPFTEYATQAEMEADAGFSITLPTAEVDKDDRITYRALPSAMIEVIYRDHDDQEEELRIRKAAAGEDITGDYNTYAFTKTVTVNGNEVTFKGREDDEMDLAAWTAGVYTYALYADGMDLDDAATVISQIS